MIISVIIPVYKVENYIRRCVQSVIDQDCDGFKIECILVDDASPDNSMVIVQEMIKNYQGGSISFLVLHHEVNKGLSAARNTGIKAATGDYLFFMDSDDYILANTFKIVYAYADKNPDVDIIMANSLCMGVNVLTNTPVTNNESSPVILNNKQQIWELLLSRKLDHHAWNKLVKRSLIISNNLMFDDGIIYEDIPWTYRLMFCISSIMIVPELTYMYEYNPTSIIHTSHQKANQILSSFAFICDSIISNPPLPDPKGHLFVDHFIFIHHWMIVAADLVRQYGVMDDTKVKLKNVRYNMLVGAVRHLRFISALYSLTLFTPIVLLLRFRWYRSNLNKLEQLVYMIAKYGDRIRI